MLIEPLLLLVNAGTWTGESAPTRGVHISPETFAVRVEDRLYTGAADWRPEGKPRRERSKDGRTIERASFRNEATGLRTTARRATFPGLALAEAWVEIENAGKLPVTITRVDSVRFRAPAGATSARHYASGWGQEFTPREHAVTGPFTVETRSGRSSEGAHPWLGLKHADGSVVCLSVAWSGNHITRVEGSERDGWTVSAGLNDWEFSTTLKPGGKLRAPSVFVATTQDGDWDAAARAFHAWHRRYGAPKTPLTMQLPVEWNHWWPYEDRRLDEATFRANIAAAAAMSMEAVLLDAGWFGPPEDTAWWDRRGDWGLVNTKRFPSGIRALSDEAHRRGLKFGLWCEIEAVGAKSDLHREHPDYIARRDGKDLGTVCFGNSEARRWAVATLDRLVRAYGVDWVKVDFNVNPGAGCDVETHGHGKGDGLFRHIEGLYSVMEAVRRKRPDLLIEGCSSGGLRLDLGWLQHVPVAFLSDPDTPAHNLQLFWGAMDYMPPSACLHWAWSETLGAFPSFNPRDPKLTPEALDYSVRTGMLGMSGFSWALPDLPEWVRLRAKRHIRTYQERVKPFVREADVFRLTGQPLRDGGGDRWCAFEYLMPGAMEAMMFVFRLPGGAETRTIPLRGLLTDATYEISRDGEDRILRRTGAELMRDGLPFEGLPEEGSALLFLKAR